MVELWTGKTLMGRPADIKAKEATLSRIYDNRWSDSERSDLKKVWTVLVEDYFQRFIKPDSVVLDLGAGSCGFINAVKAGRKIALDANPDIDKFADSNVEVIVSDDLELSMLQDSEITHVFLSNFLEHLSSSSEVVNLLRVLQRKIAPGGSILILQPNFRLVGASYFDFIDHQMILTEKSLVEALEVAGFSIAYMKKRFLPYTSKSSLPKSPGLVKAYLKLPILQYLLGKQTFVVGANTTIAGPQA